MSANEVRGFTMASHILSPRSSLLITAALAASMAVGPATAQNSSPSALTGKVTSQAEGAMEGVLVSAKRAGSTMTISVVSNAQGQYSFPRDRLEPGKYSVAIRAVGYELPDATPAQVEVTPWQSASLELNPRKAKDLAPPLPHGECLRRL